MERGADVGSHLVVCAVLNAGGNLVPMSLTSTLARKPEEAAAVEAAFAHIEAALDGDGALGRDTTEVVMDADGAEEVRIGFGVEVAPSEVDQEPQHPAVHDGDYHATHRAPDLEDLRDRLHEASRPMMLRWWDRLRAALPARG